AIALVLRPGTFLSGEPRVSVRGSLRVVRIARSEPPLALSTYASSPRVLVRDLVALPDGSVEGWLPTGTTGHNASIHIDADGHVTQRALPFGRSGFASAGRFAVAVTDEHRFMETIDRGQSWREIARPPGALVMPSSCSPVGCHL